MSRPFTIDADATWWRLSLALFATWVAVAVWAGSTGHVVLAATSVAAALLAAYGCSAAAAFIRAAHALETAHAAQMRLFDTALDRMHQGLCFFDSQHRLIVFNARYAAMYDLPVGALVPGMTLEQIVEQRYQNGTFPKLTREQYADWRKEIQSINGIVERTLEMNDGRVFLVHHEPLDDGGWVATHEDITERHNAQRHIERLAKHDPLTGLSNRLSFNENLHSLLELTSPRRPTALLYVDLDFFKTVNDRHGHHVGDALLKAAAERMHGCVRSGDFLARLGGDEFAVLLPCSGEAVASTIAQRLIEELSRAFDLDDAVVEIGASVGIAIAHDAETPAESLLQAADRALYRSKHAGRGTFVHGEITCIDASLR